MLFILMLVGLGIQTWKGFYDYEIHLYLKRLFLLDWPDFILLCILAFTVQTLVSNKYLGHFIIILYFLFGMFRGMLGFNHTLYYYGSGSGAMYSDMNGFAPYVSKLIWYKLYWGSCAVLFAFLSNLFWKRGMVGNIKSRIQEAKNRLTPTIVYGSLVFAILFLDQEDIYFTIPTY